MELRGLEQKTSIGNVDFTSMPESGKPTMLQLLVIDITQDGKVPAMLHSPTADLIQKVGTTENVGGKYRRVHDVGLGISEIQAIKQFEGSDTVIFHFNSDLTGTAAELQKKLLVALLNKQKGLGPQGESSSTMIRKIHTGKELPVAVVVDTASAFDSLQDIRGLIDKNKTTIIPVREEQRYKTKDQPKESHLALQEEGVGAFLHLLGEENRRKTLRSQNKTAAAG